MINLKTIIIDDESPARLMIRRLADQYSFLEIVAEAASGRDAIQLITTRQPDIIFLDIQLGDMTGFDVLAATTYRPVVIFTTAFDQFAIRAFEENVLDYLLKPIDPKRFDMAMTRLHQTRTALTDRFIREMQDFFSRQQTENKLSAIPIHQADKIYMVKVTDITYISANNDYNIIHTINGETHFTDKNLSTLEKLLPENFIRIQRSVIVNKEKIKEVYRYFNNRFMIVLDDRSHTNLLSGKTYATVIRQALHL